MANKKKIKPKDDNSNGQPKFPYCTTPKAFRKFLEMAPTKPKPPKVNAATLKVWGLKNTNDQTILRVLKKLDLLSSSGEPTSHYSEFMKKETGAAALGNQIINVYRSLFDNVTNPEKASAEDLKNFFNINSGGGEQTIKYQIDTFKALSEFATFTTSINSTNNNEGTSHNGAPVDKNSGHTTPSIHIDLHIHLPENKSKADYESIIESIANKIYKY